MTQYGYDDQRIARPGLTTERAAAIIVLGALAALILINRGFRGVNFGGAGVRIG